MNINNANNLTAIINVIRRTTTMVKVIPFAVAICLMFAILMQMFCGIDITGIFDLLVYQSPLNIFFLIILSYCLKLCIWHRLECILPLLPLASAFVDDNVCELTQIAARVNYGMVIVIFVASLINAYFIFIKPNRVKRR